MAKSSLDYLLSLAPVGDKGLHRETQNALFDLSFSAVSFVGAVCEFGVHEGVSSRRLINNFPDSIIYLFDSFEGLPEDYLPNEKKGAYKPDVIPVFDEPNVHVIKGLFSCTLDRFKPDGDISFIHIDCDLYSSTFTALSYCDEFIVSGTVIQFDELYNYNGFENHEYRALNDWCGIFKRDFEYIGRSHNRQACIRVINGNS